MYCTASHLNVPPSTNPAFQHALFNEQVDKEPEVDTASLLAVPFYQDGTLIGE
jgi:hypothetical protein